MVVRGSRDVGFDASSPAKDAHTHRQAVSLTGPYDRLSHPSWCSQYGLFISHRRIDQWLSSGHTLDYVVEDGTHIQWTRPAAFPYASHCPFA